MMKDETNNVYSIVALLVGATILTGCSGTVVEGWEVKKYVDACADKGGVDKIEADFRFAVCVDGATVKAVN
jgi:hypothetical protein